MTKYCPTCYVGISEEDMVCGNCGEVLKSDEIGKVNEDPSDSADTVIAAMVDENTCGTQEEPITDIEVTEFVDEKAADGSEWAEGHESEKPIEQGKVLSLGDWLITLILICIPIVNLVMLIYWSAGNEIDPNKKNFARAQLIIMAIGILLSFLFVGSIVAMSLAFISSGGYY